MSSKQSPPDFAPPALDLDWRPFDEAALDALIATVGRPAASDDPAFRAGIRGELNAAAIWRACALERQRAPTARMEARHRAKIGAAVAKLLELLPLEPDEGGVAPGGLALHPGVDALLRPMFAAHATPPTAPRTRVPPPEDEIVAWRDLPARPVEALTTEEEAEPFWGEGPPFEATVSTTGAHGSTRAAADIAGLRQLLDQVERAIEHRAAQEIAAAQDPNAEAELAGDLVGVYERLFGRDPGLSRDSATSAPSGPLLRFVRAVDGRLGLERTDEARAARIRAALAERRSPDRVK